MKIKILAGGALRFLIVLIVLYGLTSHARAQGSGILYVSNNGSSSIEKFDLATGSDLGIFAQTGISLPYGLALDGSGNLYVANYGNSTIREIAADGTDLGVFAGSGLDAPRGLAFDSTGNLYAANDNNTIEKFSSSGADLGSIVSGLSGVAGVTRDNSGNLYATNYSSNSIIRFDSSGANTTLFANDGLNGPMMPAAYAVPEPGSCLLTVLGLATLLAIKCRSRMKVGFF